MYSRLSVCLCLPSLDNCYWGRYQFPRQQLPGKQSLILYNVCVCVRVCVHVCVSGKWGIETLGERRSSVREGDFPILILKHISPKEQHFLLSVHMLSKVINWKYMNKYLGFHKNRRKENDCHLTVILPRPHWFELICHFPFLKNQKPEVESLTFTGVSKM